MFLYREAMLRNPLAPVRRRSPDFPTGETVVESWKMRQFYPVEGDGYGQPGRLILTDRYVVYAGTVRDGWWPRGQVGGFTDDDHVSFAKFGTQLVLLQPDPATQANLERMRQILRAACA